MFYHNTRDDSRCRDPRARLPAQAGGCPRALAPFISEVAVPGVLVRLDSNPGEIDSLSGSRRAHR